MTRRFKFPMAWRAVLLGVLAAAMFAVPAQAADAYHYSGEATGVQVTAFNGTPFAIDLRLCHAGPLPLAGGSDKDEVLNANVVLPGFDLSASVIYCETEGAGSRAHSFATIADLTLNLTHLLNLKSTTLQSQATATCGDPGSHPTLNGSSVIENLVINGVAVNVTGAPNQTVDLGPVDLFINEQKTNFINYPDSLYGEITVTALRITVTDPLTGLLLGEIVLSKTQADVYCPRTGVVTPPPIHPGGEVGGPCADPAYYGIFDNTGSTVALVFRFRYVNGSGLHTITKTVPAGAIFRTWEHWAKPGTTLSVAYKDPTTGNWVTLDTEQAVKGMYPPCVYKHGFSYPTP